jgi:CarD family transcriptional regulator
MADKVEKLEKLEFKKGDFVVYPVHGVGRVEGIESVSALGMSVTLYSIVFEQDRMRLKVPVAKAKTSGLRRLSSKDRIKDAISTLQGRAKIRRVMWSRRAQEYEGKINSGDPVSIAEVVRDLHRGDDQPEQSYSERQIYQAALERLARELAAVEKIDHVKAAEKIEAVMIKERLPKAA